MNRETISDALSDIADRHIAEAAAPVKQHAFPLRRIIVIAAAAALCLMLALPALASGEASYEILYAISPALAQRFKPVQLSCEDNGIRMEVSAVSVEGDTAEAYIALRDLEGDRIDGTTDLFDSWSFHTSFDSAGTCRLESYDPDTHTAVFYVRMQTMDGQDIRPDSGNITFSVHRFLSSKQTLDGVDLSPVLENLPAQPETRTDVSLRGWSGGASGMTCLLPRSEALLPVTDGIAVTAAGYVDGLLHVQVYYSDILRTDNHGFLYLSGSHGEHTCDGSVSFWDDEGSGSYEDYIFDVTEAELADYTLRGDFTACGCLTEGNWQVTFSLEAAG